jgi:hypothetical protein
MSSLMVDFIISLDGYGAAEGWPGLWGMEVPEYLAWIEEDAENEHTALMGATTYRLMSGFATEMPDDPGLAALTAMRVHWPLAAWPRHSGTKATNVAISALGA